MGKAKEYYRVNLAGWASMTVDVGVPAADLAALDSDEARNKLIHEAAQAAVDGYGAGQICAQDSGWDTPWSMEIGDNWEPAEGQNVWPITSGSEIERVIGASDDEDED